MTPLPDVFHALADPTRLALVERLGRGPRSVKELAAPLPMALPSVMKHLRVLERGGLVRSSKSGRVRTYAVAPAAFDAIEDWLSARRAGWERSFDQLERLLAEEEP